MRHITLRIGQVSTLLGQKISGDELNAILGKQKVDYHCKYTPFEVRQARLKLRHQPAPHKAFSIAVYSTIVGAGKTTIAANLGAALAWMGLRVLLIDGDPCGDLSQAVLATYPNRRNTHIASVVSGNAELARAIMPIYADGMFDVLPSSRLMLDEDIEMTTSNQPLELFKDWLERESDVLSAAYDVILIDTCSYPTNLTCNLLAGADLILGVLQFGEEAQTDATAIQRCLNAIQNNRATIMPPVLYIANGMRSGSAQASKVLTSLSEALAGTLSSVILPEYGQKKCGTGGGIGIVAEKEPSSYAAACYFELARSLTRLYIEPHHVP